MAKTKQKTEYKISKKVSLPINQSEIVDKDFIPKAIPFENHKAVLEQVAIGINYGMPVLLVGETGTGKTSIIRHLAHETNNAFVRVNHNGGTTVEDIIGRYTIDQNGTVWNDGILIKAMKNGYWYLADEINACSPEINFVYHSLLDDDGRVILVEKGNEVIVPHPNFRFFGGMNPTTEYSGTKEMNKALISRFAVVKVDFLPPKIEAKVVSTRTGVPIEVAEKMVKVSAEIRASHAKQTTRFVISTRDLIMWGHNFKIHGKFLPSAETAVLNKVSDEDIQAITDLLSLHFKSIDSGEKPEATLSEAELKQKAMDQLKDMVNVSGNGAVSNP